MKKNLLLVVVVWIIVLTKPVTVLCSDFHIVSNPSPIGTIWLGLVSYDRLPDGQVGQPYSVTFSTTGSPYPNTMTWKISGNVPGLGFTPQPGVQSATSTLSGTPTQNGTFYFTIEAKENYPNGASTRIHRYAIIVNPSPTPPPPIEKIDYTLDVTPQAVDIDLTPFLLYELGLGPDVPVIHEEDNYRIVLRKISGSSETIRLEQEGLPQGVTMWVSGTPVTASTSHIFDAYLAGELTFNIALSVERASDWKTLAGQGILKSYTVTIKGRSESGVERTDRFYLHVSYSTPRLPGLQVSSIEPLTQHGSTLIAKKQTIFKFNYTLDYSSPITVDYKLDLGPKGMWMGEPEEYHSSERWYWHYAIDLREEVVSGVRHLVHYGRITLEPTTEPRTVYLWNITSGHGFLPRPAGSGRFEVNLTIDPYRNVRWKDGSVLNISGSFMCRELALEHWIKVVLYEQESLWSAYEYHFNEAQWREYLDHICTPVGWKPSSFYTEGTWQVYPYDRYLSGIFKDYFYIRPITTYYYEGNIGWWCADTIAEEAADEGYERVIAITPPGALAAKVGDNTVGVVYHRFYGRYDQSFHTAFVDFEEAVDREHGYLYFPVIAHELSHTYRFPDIYDGYDILVPNECVYFNEFNGGVIKIFKKYLHTSPLNLLERARYWDYRWTILRILPNPSYVAARDIMDHSGKDDKSGYWSWASWKAVGRHAAGEDPPESLLISMIIFRNGTVIGRPFQKVYNHSWSWEEPEPGVTGNFSLTFYLRNGQVFKRLPYNISFYSSVEPLGNVLEDAVPFVRLVDWTEDLGKIELTGPDGRIWFSRSVSTNAPVLEIIYPPDGKKLGIGRNYTLVWKGTDADGDQLWYTVLIRREGEKVWTSLASRITEDRVSLDSDRIKLGRSDYPEGDYEIQVKATDGVNTAVKIIHVQIVKPEQIRTYTLTVGSNIGLEIEGSGTYEEGDMVKVKAPREEPMKGFFGTLGGEYQFNRWMGAVESLDSEVVVQMAGEQTSLTLTALYDENYTQVFLILGVIVIVVLIIVILVALKLGRKPKPALPSPPPPPSPP
ncbi:MAG: Ig domain-containing protein [Thermoproteota archaeon]